MEALNCEIHDCKKPIKAKGLCAMHHQRLRRHGDPQTVKTRTAKLPVPCKWANCQRMALSKGWCSKHYYINRRIGQGD